MNKAHLLAVLQYALMQTQDSYIEIIEGLTIEEQTEAIKEMLKYYNQLSN